MELYYIETTSTTRRTYVFKAEREPTVSEAIDMFDSDSWHERDDVMVDVEDAIYGEEFNRVGPFTPASQRAQA